MVKMATDSNRLNSTNNQIYLKLYEYRVYLFFILVIIIGWYPWYLTSNPGAFFYGPLIAVLLISGIFGGKNEIN